ncbi:hypothetical protein AQJ23_00960 [Streptomyces antibioticus]|nr:hypothetical protein [Streptomyces antibioticus]KUN29386.1 hypothetical protein AQJ23_00960 [Streptomyces antibioticus]
MPTQAASFGYTKQRGLRLTGSADPDVAAAMQHMGPNRTEVMEALLEGLPRMWFAWCGSLWTPS